MHFKIICEIVLFSEQQRAKESFVFGNQKKCMYDLTILEIDLSNNNACLEELSLDIQPKKLA